MNVNDFSVIHLFAITFASLGSSDFFQIMFYCFAPTTHTVTCTVTLLYFYLFAIIFKIIPCNHSWFCMIHYFIFSFNLLLVDIIISVQLPFPMNFRRRHNGWFHLTSFTDSSLLYCQPQHLQKQQLTCPHTVRSISKAGYLHWNACHFTVWSTFCSRGARSRPQQQLASHHSPTHSPANLSTEHLLSPLSPLVILNYRPNHE